MTRDEAHALLDAVLDTNCSQDRYDIDCTFQNNFDGSMMANVQIHDNRLNNFIAQAQPWTGVVKSFVVADCLESVWDAIKDIAKYKERIT